MVSLLAGLQGIIQFIIIPSSIMWVIMLKTADITTPGMIEAAKGISARVVQMAEYQKMIRGGMCAEEMEKIFYQTGFSKARIEYYWFLGQGKVMSQSPDMSQKIESYLRSILPLSRQLFKYFKIEAWK